MTTTYDPSPPPPLPRLYQTHYPNLQLSLVLAIISSRSSCFRALGRPFKPLHSLLICVKLEKKDLT